MNGNQIGITSVELTSLSLIEVSHHIEIMKHKPKMNSPLSDGVNSRNGD